MHQSGFSLIEVMIAAGILAAISYAGMELVDQMRRGQKRTEQRFEVFGLFNEKKSLLANDLSCLESFKDIDIRGLMQGEEHRSVELPFTSLKKVIIKKDQGHHIIEKFKISSPDSASGGIPIVSYSLFKGEEDFIMEDAEEAQLQLQITYRLQDNYKIVKKFPISFTFTGANLDRLASCHSIGSGSIGGGGGGLLQLLDPLKEPQLTGKTGFESCEAEEKTCRFVSSLNYASQTYGNQPGLSNLCQINYNQNLTGVEQGGPISNIHSCEVKLGQYKTYELNQKDFGVTCQGIFMAHCQ